MQKNSEDSKADSPRQADVSDRREFLHQAGVAGGLLTAIGLAGADFAMPAGYGSDFLTPPIETKVMDMKRTTDANGSEAAGTIQMTDANGLKALNTVFVRRTDYGDRYVVISTSFSRYFPPSSEQPSRVFNHTEVVYGQKGPVSDDGAYRTDTIDLIVISKGEVQRQQQTVKVLTNPRSQFQGMSWDEIAKKMLDSKLHTFERGRQPGGND